MLRAPPRPARSQAMSPDWVLLKPFLAAKTRELCAPARQPQSRVSAPRMRAPRSRLDPLLASRV